MANEAEQVTAEGLKILEQMRAFMAEHPEVANALGVPAPAGPPVPLTVAHIFHDLVDLIPGIDQERRGQMHATLEQHYNPPPAEDDSKPAPAAAEAPPERSSPAPGPVTAAAAAEPAYSPPEPAEHPYAGPAGMGE